MSSVDKNVASPAVQQDRSATLWHRTQWVFALAGAAAAILLPFFGGLISVALTLTIPFTIIHGTRRYGWKLFLAFFVVTFVISNAFEDLSILTGFPFGHYHYTGALKLFHVPVMIGPIYFGLGYVSWLVASTIFDRADEHLDLRQRSGRINVVGLPILAAAVMTMFDVGSDSVASTIGGTWVWEEGGGVFGVPFTNYLGWWFVTYVFFQIFALMLARRQSRGSSPAGTAMVGDMLQPVIIYLSLGLNSVGYFIVTAGSADVVTDPAGTSWGVAALTETMMIINIFSLVAIAFIALVRIAGRQAGSVKR